MPRAKPRLGTHAEELGKVCAAEAALVGVLLLCFVLLASGPDSGLPLLNNYAAFIRAKPGLLGAAGTSERSRTETLLRDGEPPPPEPQALPCPRWEGGCPETSRQAIYCWCQRHSVTKNLMEPASSRGLACQERCLCAAALLVVKVSALQDGTPTTATFKYLLTYIFIGGTTECQISDNTPQNRP